MGCRPAIRVIDTFSATFGNHNPITPGEAMLRLQNNLPDTSIPCNELYDGQVAIITRSPHEDQVGRIVQRASDRLITISQDAGFSWSMLPRHIQVRVLPNGPITFVLEDNE